MSVFEMLEAQEGLRITQVKLNRAIAELRTVKAERDAAIAERDNAWNSMNRTIQISTKLEAERDQAIAERDRLAADLYKAMLALKECE